MFYNNSFSMKQSLIKEFEEKFKPIEGQWIIGQGDGWFLVEKPQDIWSFIEHSLQEAVKDGFKKGYFKGVLDSEHGQITSEELLTQKPKGK